MLDSCWLLHWVFLADAHHGPGITHAGLTLHAPATWHTVVGTGMSALMWCARHPDIWCLWYGMNTVFMTCTPERRIKTDLCVPLSGFGFSTVHIMMGTLYWWVTPIPTENYSRTHNFGGMTVNLARSAPYARQQLICMCGCAVRTRHPFRALQPWRRALGACRGAHKRWRGAEGSLTVLCQIWFANMWLRIAGPSSVLKTSHISNADMSWEMCVWTPKGRLVHYTCYPSGFATIRSQHAGHESSESLCSNRNGKSETGHHFWGFP